MASDRSAIRGPPPSPPVTAVRRPRSGYVLYEYECWPEGMKTTWLGFPNSTVAAANMCRVGFSQVFGRPSYEQASCCECVLTQPALPESGLGQVLQAKPACQLHRSLPRQPVTSVTTKRSANCHRCSWWSAHTNQPFFFGCRRLQTHMRGQMQLQTFVLGTEIEFWTAKFY